MTWFGHSSVLARVGRTTVLIDPVFSERISRVIHRRHPLVVPANTLSNPDILLITHNHRDHLDEPTIRQLPRPTRVIAPPGLGTWFCRRGFHEVIELPWWEQCLLGDLEITSVPAYHWSRRTPWDTNRSGWCGFVLRRSGDESALPVGARVPRGGIYHGGDTGWFEGFREIGKAFPGLEAVLLPVGGYEPTWLMGRHHLNPEQAGEAFLATGGRKLIPIHWGTFALSDEPADEPIRRLRAWWDRQPAEDPRRLVIPRVGVTMGIGG